MDGLKPPRRKAEIDDKLASCLQRLSFSTESSVQGEHSGSVSGFSTEALKDICDAEHDPTAQWKCWVVIVSVPPSETRHPHILSVEPCGSLEQ